MTAAPMLQFVNDEAAFKQLTPTQEEYVCYVLEGKSDTEISAIMAIHPPALWDLKRNPFVASEIFARAASALRHQVFPAAVHRLHKILLDESESSRNVIAAAKTVLQYEQASEMMRAKLPGGIGKPAEEMTQGELKNRAVAIRAELRELDRERQFRARDVTPQDPQDT